MGLPKNLVNLIKNWLTNRGAYVEVNQNCSKSFKTHRGTVQGSVLGPILFSLFIAPVFDVVDDLLAFADDSYTMEEAASISELIPRLQTKVDKVYIWLKDSGLVVNESKTEFIIFKRKSYQNSQSQKVSIQVGLECIENQSSINVLGVTFDEFLDWNLHVNNTINRTKKTVRT